MPIARDFINDLLARTDIVSLVDSRVTLKKAGKNYSACCPFHGEKTPSFTVSQDKQFYHCFGCGAHGNAIDFLMEYDRLDFPDAVEELAGLHGLEVIREQGHGAPRAPRPSQDLYELMEQVGRYYQAQLRHHADRQKVIDYLKGRGLSGEVVKKFRIGFAPDAWDGVLSQHRQSKDEQDKLVETGVLIQNDQGRRYDRFRDRLMFPIRDRRGRVIGFGGRVLGDGTPKYLNSPETPIFHKGQELYGLYELKQAIRDPQQVVVVEGYMDVVALAQYGIDYAVASLGTSTTAEQMQLLQRTASKVVCCYDGDRAGREAAWRAMETALPQLRPGDQLAFVFLPDGEDPDSFVRQQGKDAFEAELDKATPLHQFLFDTLAQSHRVEDGSLAKRALTLIETVKDSVLQETLLENLAYRLRLNSAAELKRKFGVSSRPSSPAKDTGGLKGRGTPLRLAIALLVQNPELGLGLSPQPVLKHLTLNGVELFADLLEKVREVPLTSGQLLELYRDHPQANVLKRLAQWSHQIAADNQSAEFTRALYWLNEQYLEQKYQQLSSKSQLSAGEKRQLAALIAQMKQGQG
ncbi:DNA primase [Paraferrimonas sedimenticola]|uniref:DNA primase n=1 Tax=Paraferrimonas sedimenticola TaxID=375674 RepID=A0AA37RXG2_9GAMM|nr:DNA primase [Paraferrimonas sedimenticola]GLP97251.1 DNA primase [Paraferrimonas sedimenticola]